MKTVIFDELDSYDDLGLIRTGVTIGSPSPKINTVDIEGADSSLDLTDYFGEVFYENRELEFEFQALDEPGNGFHEKFQRLCNALHGKRSKITLSECPSIYYVGRITVDEWQTNEKTGAITVTADCEPYYYLAEPTVVSLTVDGAKTQAFENLRKRVVPTFELSAAMQIAKGTQSFETTSGTWSDSRLFFGQGETELTFTGNGTVKVTYQERGL